MALAITGAAMSGVMWGVYVYFKSVAQICPKYVSLQEDFDRSLYLGRWFELRRQTKLWFQKGQCSYAEYSPKGDY